MLNIYKMRANRKLKKFFSGAFLSVLTLLICFILLEFALQSDIIKIERNSLLDPDGFISLPFSKETPEYENIGRFDEILGYSLAENLRDVIQINTNTKVNTNSIGTRGINEYDLDAKKNIRIMTLGDSFTFGEGVNDNETFSAFLEAKDSSIEVMNLGVFAYGFDQTLLRYEILGMKYRPDIVILGFWEDDARRDNYDFFLGLEKPRFKLNDGKINIENVPIKNPLTYQNETHLKSIRLLHGIFRRLTLKKEDNPNNLLSYYILKRLIEDSEGINASVVFLNLPSYDDVLGNRTVKNKLFLNLCNEEEIICIDPVHELSEFMAGKENSSIYFDCSVHYCPEIHKVIADYIYEAIKDKTKFNKY